MSKDPVRRNFMFGVLRADIAGKEDETIQAPRSLFQ
jgi:hypothetical protein